MAYKVIITEKAARDLAVIDRFISRDNPDAAQRFCGELLALSRSLQTLPHQGSFLFGNQSIRKVVHQSYLVVYRVMEKGQRIEILRFWHAAQDRRYLRLRETPPAYGMSA